MHKRIGLIFIAAAGPLMLGGLLWDHPAGGWIFALASALFPVALVLISVQPGRRRPKLGGVLVALSVVLVASSLGVLWATGFGATTRALIMLLGLGLAPLPIVIWGFAADFQRGFLDRERLERLRRDSVS